MLDFYPVCEYLGAAAAGIFGDVPARAAWLDEQKDRLDYPSALARALPIGSGEIESAHRYVVQKRLKLPGAWCRAANAEQMLALRPNRANHQWHMYWATALKQAD